MSVLKLKCYDQALTIMTTPVIASGVKEVNELQVEFNDAWNEFGKVAVFYRDDTKAYHVVMDENNKCIIPHEVTETDGVMYLGVFGNHGNKRLTSNILRYKIVKGAILEGEEPKPPTPDIYEQILAVYGQILNKYESIFADIDKIVADSVLQGVVNQFDGTTLIKMWLGTKEEYDKIEVKDDYVIYYVIDENHYVYHETSGDSTTLKDKDNNALYPKTKISNIINDNGGSWSPPQSLKVKNIRADFNNGYYNTHNHEGVINALYIFISTDDGDEYIYDFRGNFVSGDAYDDYSIKITDSNYANYSGIAYVYYLGV